MKSHPHQCGPTPRFTDEKIWDLLEQLKALGAAREIETYLVPIEVTIDGQLVRTLARIDVSLAASLCTCSDHRPSDPCGHVLESLSRTRFAVEDLSHA